MGAIASGGACLNEEVVNFTNSWHCHRHRSGPRATGTGPTRAALP